MIGNQCEETIQDIAYKVMLEQSKNDNILNGPNERTVFVLGSKGGGKTSLINHFLDRNEQTRPTLALEYSYGIRSNTSSKSNQKLIANIWELGLATANQLIEVPIRSHGLLNFSVAIMLNLANPSRLLIDLELALQGIKQSISNNYSETEIKQFRDKIVESTNWKDHSDFSTLEILPCSTVIIGGMYDIFQDLDPEIKKHVCRFLRSVAHTLGAALIFYSVKNTSLTKIMRDVLSNCGFGSPLNPIRAHKYDYNDAIVISAGADSWDQIGVLPSNSERVGINFKSEIPQLIEKSELGNDIDPAKDSNFREPIIDELRALKDEELLRLIKSTEINLKFDSFSFNSSSFNYLN